MSISFYQSVPQDILETISNLDFSLGGQAKQHEVNLLLEKTVLVGGKRLRPLLTMLMGRLVGIPNEQLAPYARLIELLHAASLAHDDVIDNATMRRSVDSINIVASNKKAVLAGDFLFAEVIVAVAQEGNLELVQEVAKVIQQLSAGEWLQLELAQERTIDMQQVEEVARYKTASVLIWCSIVGVCLAKQQKGDRDWTKLQQLAYDFGLNLGLAFQFVDDTLDFDPTGQKDFMLDEENGVLNAVMVHWLNLDQQAREQFLAGQHCTPNLADPLFQKAISKVRTLALEHLNLSRSCLQQMVKELDLTVEQQQAYATPLYELLDFLANRQY